MLLQLDGTFIFVVISFLIFLYIMKKILYTPITSILNARSEFIERNSKTQVESKQKAKALIEEKDAAIKKSRQEAGDMIKQASEEAKEKSKKILKETKQKAKAKVKEHEMHLAEESKNAKIEVRNEMSGIVGQLVSKILQEDVVVTLEDEQIDKYLKI